MNALCQSLSRVCAAAVFGAGVMFVVEVVGLRGSMHFDEATKLNHAKVLFPLYYQVAGGGLSAAIILGLLGRFPALAGLDLRVDPGEVVLLQGPNGAGKSTLLRLCAGLVRLERGTGTILGHDLDRDRRALRRRVGLVGHATQGGFDLRLTALVTAMAFGGAIVGTHLAHRVHHASLRRIFAWFVVAVALYLIVRNYNAVL